MEYYFELYGNSNVNLFNIEVERMSDISFRLDVMIKEIQDKGMDEVLLDRCQDRDFCQMLGLDYHSNVLPKEMKEMVELYAVSRGIKL